MFGPLNAVNMLFQDMEWSSFIIGDIRYHMHLEAITICNFKIIASNIRACHNFFPHFSTLFLTFVTFRGIAPQHGDLEIF